MDKSVAVHALTIIRKNVAEISCLIVRPDYQQKEKDPGFEACIRKGKRNNIKQIFALLQKQNIGFSRRVYKRGKHVLPKEKFKRMSPETL